MGMTVLSWADCRYFRKDTHFEKCRAAKASEMLAMPDYSAPDSDVPELPKTTEGPFVKITCACDYSLSGYNPLCDLDKTEEKSIVRGTDDVAATCRRKETLCSELCPPME